MRLGEAGSVSNETGRKNDARRDGVGSFRGDRDGGGPLPERIEDAPANFAAHCRLMRAHEPRLNTLTDAEIRAIMAVDDP